MSFKIASRTALISTLALVGALTACVKSEDKSAVSESASSVSFDSVCESWGLTRCDVSPDDVNMKQSDWQVGVDVFREILSSPSSVNLKREDFNRQSVTTLFNMFGASSLMAFVNRVPWQSLKTEIESIVLTNAQPSQSLEVNGLKLIAGQRVVLRLARNRTLSVSGLSISDADGGNLQNVTSIDLNTAGALQINTDKQRITNVPISFFVIDGLVKTPNLTPAAVFNGISNVVLDPGLPWRTSTAIILKNRNMVNLMNLSDSLVPTSSAFGGTVAKVIRNAQAVVFGGSESTVLSVSLGAPMKCQMKFENVPVLGKIDIGLDFATGFGINNLSRASTGVVQAKIYGIKTSMGTVTQAEINGEAMKLKVGAFTIPLEFKAQVAGKGVQLKDVVCQ